MYNEVSIYVTRQSGCLAGSLFLGHGFCIPISDPPYYTQTPPSWESLRLLLLHLYSHYSNPGQDLPQPPSASSCTYLLAGTAGSVPGAAPPARSVPRAAHFSRLRLLTWEAVVLCDLNPTHLTGRRRPVPPAPGLASCPGRLASAPLHLAFRWTSRDATLTR